MKEISIIVPCYNVDNSIDRCVRSIVSQTIGLEHLEIILVNDASTDHTYDKLCEWEQRYSDHIMVISLQENMRQGGARNTGMLYASGEYIGFLDADDWIEPEMYEALYQAITLYDCEVASCRLQRETEAGELIDIGEKEYDYDRKMVIKTIEDRKHFLQTGMPGSIVTKLYQKRFIVDNDLSFPEQISYEDNYWFGMTDFCLQSYVIINKKMYHYMVNMNSTTVSISARHLDRLKIEMMKIEEYQRRGYWNQYHDEIEKSFLQLYWCNTLAILFTRFPVVSEELINLMRTTVKHWFPNYLQNPYIQSFNGIDRRFLRLIEVELTEEQINQFAAFYREPNLVHKVDETVKRFFLS